MIFKYSLNTKTGKISINVNGKESTIALVKVIHPKTSPRSSKEMQNKKRSTLNMVQYFFVMVTR